MNMSDYLPVGDGSVLVSRYPCPECSASVTQFRGVLWDDNDDPHECAEEVSLLQACAEWARFRLAWIAWSVREFFRDLWDGIPGPLPVKVLAMALLCACLAIPGPLDELIVILALRYVAKRRNANR